MFAMALAACTSTYDAEEVQFEADEMLRAYHSEISESGLLSEFKYLDSSSSFFWIPPGYNEALGYDAVRKAVEANAKGIQSMKLEWKTLEVIPLSNDLATFYGEVAMLVTDTAGNVNRNRLLESGTLIRRKSGWKLLSGQTRNL
jgi:hypothetical protein